MNRLKEKYLNEVVSSLKEKYNYKSIMEVPKLEKIVINMGVGDATGNSKLIDAAVADLAKISGQKPVVTRAKKSIAGFKVREGQAIGCKVTLRGEQMYNFLDKLISISLPRVRDFRGVSSKAFDGRGNYTMGIKEQLIFSEIDYDDVVKVRGMDIVFVTTAKSNDEAYDLLWKFRGIIHLFWFLFFFRFRCFRSFWFLFLFRFLFFLLLLFFFLFLFLFFLITCSFWFFKSF